MAMHLLKVSRLEALTDGIFAIAMTIMILNLHIPAHLVNDYISEQIKLDIYINLFIYIGSFTILGTHWIAMNFQWGLLDKLNRIYLWANMFYLMIICIIPFSAYLLGEYPDNTFSIYFYAINLLSASFGQFVVFECARYFRLYKIDLYTPAIRKAALLRVLIAPTCIYMIPGKIDQYEGTDFDNN